MLVFAPAAIGVRTVGFVESRPSLENAGGGPGMKV